VAPLFAAAAAVAGAAGSANHEYAGSYIDLNDYLNDD